jgi:hypothetical protein
MSVDAAQPDIREARFVLWALRSAIAFDHGDERAQAEIMRGFELADVMETSRAFWEFAATLCALRWEHTVWHDPRCGCMSTEETIVLRALAESASELRGDSGRPLQWWSLLLPADAIQAIHVAASAWVRELDRAGVVLPAAHDLARSIHPLENLVEPAGRTRLN